VFFETAERPNPDGREKRIKKRRTPGADERPLIANL
jgi:hypothetical protein